MELAAESKIKLKDVGLTLKRTIFYFLAAFKINYFTSTYFTWFNPNGAGGTLCPHFFWTPFSP